MAEILVDLPTKFAVDHKDIRTRTRNQQVVMFKKIDETMREYLHVKRTPYDKRAARDEYVAAQTSIWNREGARHFDNNTPVSERVLENVKVKNFDLAKYGDIKNFTHYAKIPINEHKLIDGIRQTVVTGHYHAYHSKLPPGCSIDVLHPVEGVSIMQPTPPAPNAGDKDKVKLK